MKTGVYKIFLKAKPTKFFIIGTANFDAYWAENGDKTMDSTLLRECNKVELAGYTEHFIQKLKPTWDGKPIKEAEKASEVETASMPEVKSEKAVFAKLPSADNSLKTSKPKKVIKKKK